MAKFWRNLLIGAFAWLIVLVIIGHVRLDRSFDQRDWWYGKYVDMRADHLDLLRSINHSCTWTQDGHGVCEVGALPTTSTTVKP